MRRERMITESAPVQNTRRSLVRPRVNPWPADLSGARARCTAVSVVQGKTYL